MRRRRPWARLNVTVKFALIIAVLGVLIAIVPLALVGRENGVQASERAADKAGIAATLVAGQQRSLAAFATGMAEELAPALNVADAGALATSLQHYSDVNTVADVVGIDGAAMSVAARAGGILPSGAAVVRQLAKAATRGSGIVPGPDGAPWLLATAQVPNTAETAFIARPLDGAFVRGLEATITTASEPAGLAIVRSGRVVVAGAGALAPGARVDSAMRPTVAPGAPAQVVDVGGGQAGAAAQALGGGYAVLVTTPVALLTALWAPVALLLALILIAMLCIVLVVQTDLQRPLRRLDRAVSALARDQYDVPVPRVANAEIGRLAASFEEMRRQLHGTINAARARAAIATELNSPQPLETALHEVCAHLRASSSADCAFILVNGSEMTDSFVVSSGEPMDVDVAAVLTGEGPAGAAFRHNGPQALHVGAGPGSDEATTGLRDFCVAPLRMGRTVLGVAGVARRVGGFRAGDADLVASSAEQVALALERYRFIAMVQRQASIDDLTGLYNHRFLVDYLGQQLALAERLNTPLAVLMIDLDHFKRVNDTYGHPVGDAVLTAFAATLTGSVRRADLAARYGGEEFIVVMSNTGAPEARIVAEKIRAAAAGMRVPVEGTSVVITLSVSVGGAAYPEDTTTAAELLATADAALYDAKHTGRDRVCMAGDRGELEGTSNVTSVVRARRSAQ